MFFASLYNRQPPQVRGVYPFCITDATRTPESHLKLVLPIQTSVFFSRDEKRDSEGTGCNPARKLNHDGFEQLRLGKQRDDGLFGVGPYSLGFGYPAGSQPLAHFRPLVGPS